MPEPKTPPKTGLIAVGRLPKVSRAHGRNKGKWRGHEHLADELRLLASREKDPEMRWGQIATRVTPTKAQSIVSAVKKGEAVGFEHHDGSFESISRKSPNQARAPKNRNTGQPIMLYDVWARFTPTT